MHDEPASRIIHATSVAVLGNCALILGPSGSGKSALALKLIALGAQLVSDDRTQLTHSDGSLIASAPVSIEGLIEARGVGLIQTEPAGPTPVTLLIDLARKEPDRLPKPHACVMQGITLPCLWGISEGHFAAAVLLYLTGGIRASHD